MNLLAKHFSIALSLLYPFVALSSEQAMYEIGDCMKISDVEMVARLCWEPQEDNELAKRCIEEERRTKKEEAAQALVEQGLPQQSKQLKQDPDLKKDFARSSQKLHDDLLREDIDQELAHLEELMKQKKKEALTQRCSQLLSKCESLLTAVTAEVLAEKSRIDAEHERHRQQASKALQTRAERVKSSACQKPSVKNVHATTQPLEALLRPSPVARSASQAARTKAACPQIVTYHLTSSRPNPVLAGSPAHHDQQMVGRRAELVPSRMRLSIDDSSAFNHHQKNVWSLPLAQGMLYLTATKP